VPVLSHVVGAAAAKCAECGEPFEPRRAGLPKRFCSTRCRVAHHSRNRRQRANGATAEPAPDPEPVAVWERPMMDPYAKEAPELRDALAVPKLPWEQPAS
jgi:hypothetical protein